MCTKQLPPRKHHSLTKKINMDKTVKYTGLAVVYTYTDA